MSWRSASSEEALDVLFQNFLIERGNKVVYVLTDPTAGRPQGTGAVQKYWN